MCGLVGILNYRRDQPVNAEELLAVREHMRTRGLDNAGMWLNRDRKVGLA